MEKTESIYGAHKPVIEQKLKDILAHVEEIRKTMEATLGMDPVEHCLGRVKSEESMREKCRRNNLPETTESALEKLYDAIGVRIVCAFVDDVYTIRDFVVNSGRYEVLKEKDYIRRCKPNGYRSYHMILRVDGNTTPRSSFALYQWIHGRRWSTILNIKRTLAADRRLL